ncbi:MAG TPA: hypothetical protein VFA83_01135 [Acidimicrobiales bacterium]|nr:hypothetical protein [Acidimicrobiales bacterium]
MRWLAMLAGLALVGAACGSTIQQTGQRGGAGQASGDAGLNGTTNGTTGSNELGDTSGSTGGGAAAGSFGGGTSGRSASGSSGSGSSRGSSSGGAGSASLGPGVTATTIDVGIIYATNGGAANAAIGAAGISQGDEKANYDVLFADINAHGGIAGRKVVGVYHAIDATSTAATSDLYQAACDDLTQDHKVFVAFAGNDETLLQCLNNRGVLAVSSNLTVADTAVFRRFPYYFEINSLNLDRVAAAEIPALKAQGWFSGWNSATGQPGPARAKVGVITFDFPSFAHAVDQVLVPALANAGYAPGPGDVVRVPYAVKQSDLGPTAAAISSAVLKFRSDGVSHVIILEASGTLSLLFGNNADSQRYYPRYGANSQNGQEALLLSGAFPKSQLNGTLGIGWQPSLDVAPSESGPYTNAAQHKCMALYSAHGITFSDQNAQGVGYLNCATTWFFRDVMKRVTGLTRDGFLAAANGIGSNFESLTVIPTRVDATHHDGIAAVRYWAYKPECSCMRYTSGDVAA